MDAALDHERDKPLKEKLWLGSKLEGYEVSDHIGYNEQGSVD